MAEKVTINVDAKTSKAQKALEDLNKNLEQVAETGDRNREGFEILDKVTGGYAGKIKDLAGTITGAVKGAKAFATSLKGVRGALLATGIGAIVVALGTIIAYWDEIVALFDDGTKALQDQEQEHRDILSVTEQELAVAENTQRILELQGKDVTVVREEKKRLLKVQMQENDLLLENLKSQLAILQAESEKWKLIRNREKENKAIAEVEEKINKAILNRQKLEINLLGIEKKASDEKKKADEDEKKRREDANKKRKEDKEKEAKEEEEAEKKKQEALEKIRQGEIDTEEERRAEERKKIQDHYKELIRLAKLYGEDTSALVEAQATKEKELQDKFDKEDKDRLEKKQEEDKKKREEEQEKKIEKLELDKEFDNLTFEEQRAILQAREQLLLEDETLSDEQRTELAKQFKDARVKIADLEFKEKQRAMMGYASALGDISGVIGEETEAGKAMAVASSLISTYASIAGQLEAFSGVPVPGYAIAQAIATGAVGLANVKKIISTKVPRSSGGGGASAGASVGGATPQAPSFNIVGATETSQLAEAIGEQTQEPVQAYVVANDVTTAQSLENNIVEGATL
jgi:hypothetical protein